MTKTWKKMEIGDIYKALQSMTPEERLKELYEAQKKLGRATRDAIKPSKEEVGQRILSFIEEYIQDLEEEYEDYSFPYQVMLNEAEDIIRDMVNSDKFYELIKDYMKEIL